MRSKPLDYSDPEFKLSVLDRFNTGMSRLQIAKELGIDRTKVALALKKYGIAATPRPTVNKDFFEVIDTPAKAWVLGLLYADGCVSNHRLGFALEETDLKVVELVQKHLEYTGKIYHQKERSMKSLDGRKTYIARPQKKMMVYNKKLTTDLAKHGCVPNKSLITTFPATIPEPMIPHFVRGYFEGDGCISLNKPKKQLKIDIKGSEAFLTGIADYTAQKLKQRGHHITLKVKPVKGTRIYSANLSGMFNVLEFLNLMYTDSHPDLRMERKYMKVWNSLDYIKRNRVTPLPMCFAVQHAPDLPPQPYPKDMNYFNQLPVI